VQPVARPPRLREAGRRELQRICRERPRIHPYNLAVGGTDFDITQEAQYWSGANQPGVLASAQSHIPEMVWNDTCGNPVLSTYYLDTDPSLSATPRSSIRLRRAVGQSVHSDHGRRRGVSSCITADVSGACTAGYPQPSWQTGWVSAITVLVRYPTFR